MNLDEAAEGRKGGEGVGRSDLAGVDLRGDEDAAVGEDDHAPPGLMPQLVEEAGIDTILVLSGEGTREDVGKYGVVPTWIYPDVAAVLSDLKKEHGI